MSQQDVHAFPTSILRSPQQRDASYYHPYDVSPSCLNNALRSNDSDSEETTRRSFLSGTGSSGMVLAAMMIPAAPQPAQAAKGAAEYDLEYYIRDLVKGNRREGNLPVSPGPPTPPPRTLTQPLLSLLLDDDFSSCVPVQLLNDIVEKDSAGSSTTLSRTAQMYRERSNRGFASRAQWNVELVTDQYYFDLTAYALWRTAADLLPNYRQRDAFARNVGRSIYARGTKEGVFLSNSSSKEEDGVPLTRTVPALTDILTVFQKAQFCSSFRLGEDNINSEDNMKNAPLFDELDDDGIRNGGTVNCLISIYRPATLGAALQITGEGSRFSPEYIGCTLAAMFETYGIQSSHETYFVDPEYRPNPKDYFPDEQLYQFTLSKM